jgi:hypothetical protein
VAAADRVSLAPAERRRRLLIPLKATPTHHVTTAHVEFGLGHVAAHLDLPTLRRHEYAQGWAELVSTDRRRHGDRARLDQLLPTVAQIEAIPQHARGRKHERRVALADWQQEIVTQLAHLSSAG